MMVRARSVDFILYFALKVILTTSVRRCGIRGHASCLYYCRMGLGAAKKLDTTRIKCN